MPEGDTLHQLAALLRPVLLGHTVTRLVLPRFPAPTTTFCGTKVTQVEAAGKNLLISFNNAWVLHTHLRMSGAWHVYAPGEAWKRSRISAVAVLELSTGFTAVCFSAPTVRLLEARKLGRDPQLGRLGPDLLGATFDDTEALKRLRAKNHLPLGVAVMAQSLIAGIGNVYKSEFLFNLHLDPFAPLSSYSDEELARLLSHARELMQKNIPLHTRTTRFRRGLSVPKQSVYRRQGEPCFDCRTPIAMQRQGEAQRSTYYCPTCQPKRT